MTPSEYLDAAKAKLGIESDYELAKRLDIPRTYVSDFRRQGKRWPDVATMARLAVILEVDPAGAIMDMEAQHTKDERKAAFLRDFALRAATGKVSKAARTLASIFIGVLLAAVVALGLNDATGASRFERRRGVA